MSEQQPDIQPQAAGGEGDRKLVVFAPRIDPGLREQIEGIRSITGQTINDLGNEALQDWVDKKLADEDVRTKAMVGIEEEERRLRERRAAVERVLGSAATTSSDVPSPSSEQNRRRGKPSGE